MQNAALVVREKINAAIQDLPEVEEIKHLLAGTCKYVMIRDEDGVGGEEGCFYSSWSEV